jgi:hypothetical protein
MIGWVWAGVGAEGPAVLNPWKRQFYGGYVFLEGSWTILKNKWHVDCGTCRSDCKPAEEHGSLGGEGGFGVAGFPIVMKAGEKRSIKESGVELGVLLTPKSLCEGIIEVILLIDLLNLWPPGATIKRMISSAEKFVERFNLHMECGAGIDISGTMHVCKSATGGVGGWTIDSALICGGVFVGCNVGLGHSKAEMPGQS